MRVLQVFILSIVIIGAACQEAPTSSQEEIELLFFTVDMGQNSGRSAAEFTIRSEWEYQNTFGESSGGFNFQDEMLIAVYKGQLSTTGHTYQISRVVDRGDDIRVTVTFEQCRVCNTANSSPYHIIGLQRSGKRVNFIELVNN